MPAIFFISYVSLWILVVMQGLLLLLVYRHFGLMALGTVEGISRDGLPVGREAPPFQATTVDGEVAQWVPSAGRNEILAFVSPDCEPCAKILPSLNQLASTHPGLGVTLLVRGTHDAVTQLAHKFRLETAVQCLADGEERVYSAYHVRVTPFAFLISRDRQIVAKGLCDTDDKLRKLLAAGGVEILQTLDVVPRST